MQCTVLSSALYCHSLLLSRDCYTAVGAARNPEEWDHCRLCFTSTEFCKAYMLPDMCHHFLTSWIYQYRDISVWSSRTFVGKPHRHKFCIHQQDTALYVQQQFRMSDEHIIDFVEVHVLHTTFSSLLNPGHQQSDYRVDPDQAIIMGLPPPQNPGTSWRNYDLSHALLRACLTVSTSAGSVSRAADGITDASISLATDEIVRYFRQES
jgi:hypothetical protein